MSTYSHSYHRNTSLWKAKNIVWIKTWKCNQIVLFLLLCTSIVLYQANWNGMTILLKIKISSIGNWREKIRLNLVSVWLFFSLVWIFQEIFANVANCLLICPNWIFLWKKAIILIKGNGNFHEFLYVVIVTIETFLYEPLNNRLKENMLI